ncbi:MAG: hypothetical protein IJQ65_00380, partial [Kiritimatiellae bacterium]|nr:hypothetical protein [Kiritimatiellia bacterium]
MKKAVLSILVAACASATSVATPVGVEWKPSEKMPVSVARPFAGFLPDGRFIVAGGTDFVANPEGVREKTCFADVCVRSPDGTWTKAAPLPHAAGEGVTCETPRGVFCAGGYDGANVYSDAYILTGDGVEPLPSMPAPVMMGAAACDGEKVYVVSGRTVYSLALSGGEWVKVAELPGGVRSQMVAAIQNGDQKEKRLVIFGGYDVETKEPLSDGYALVLSSGELKPLAPLPDGTTTIGAVLLPSGHQHVLMFGGLGKEGWIARAINGSNETDPVKLGWQRKVLAYNCVTDAWCEYGALADGDTPRCGAAAGIRPGKTPESYTVIIAGGEKAPALRTDVVSVASFRKTGKFGATAWAVVGVYALLMVGMACFFIFKKKDENDYFRGGNRIPWYVAGMSIFATMLSSITFIAIPTQAYLQDWRYFVMAFFIIGMAPVAIYYYLPFFCRLGITSAYEYLEKRFNLGVRLFGSAAFVVFMVCRVAVVTLLPAIALNAVTGVSIDACILICGVLTMIYCSLGGLEAVIWSDFVQGIVLMG